MSSFHCRNRFYIKFPGRDLGGGLSFYKGFRNDAWIALIITILLVPALLHSVYFILTCFTIMEDTRWTYGWNLFVFSGALAQQVQQVLQNSSLYCFIQGSESQPSFQSTRIIFAMILLSSVVLFQNFAASYTSFLSVVAPLEPFDSVKTLWSDTNTIIGTREGVAMYDMFIVSKS